MNLDVLKPARSVEPILSELGEPKHHQQGIGWLQLELIHLAFRHDDPKATVERRAAVAFWGVR
jgi:hypothetical protein